MEITVKKKRKRSNGNPFLLLFSFKSILYFSLLGFSVSFLLVICGRPFANAATVQIPIGAIIPITTTGQEGTDMVISIMAGFKRFGTYLEGGATVFTNPNTTFILDDESNPFQGLAHVQKLVLTHGVAGVIGAWNSAVTAQVATSTAISGIVQLGGASSAALLSIKKNYPTYVRVISADDISYQIQAEVAYAQGWRKVGIIHTDDVFGTDGANMFRSRSEQLGIEVSVQEIVPFGIGRLEKQNVVREKLQKIKASGAKIILMNAVLADVREIIVQAEELEMIGTKEYLYLAGKGWNTDAISQGWPGHEQSLSGIQGVEFRYRKDSPEWAQYIQDFNNIYVNHGFGADPNYTPTSKSPLYYDAIHLWAVAFNATVPKVQSMGINIECFRGDKSLSQAGCQMSDAERDALYQRAVTKDYQGVVEMMQFLKSKSASFFGPLANSIQCLLLESIYDAEFDAATVHIKLNRTGDTWNQFQINNYQERTQKWEVVGIVDPTVNPVNVTMISKVVYPGGTASNPNYEVTSDNIQGAGEASSDDSISLTIVIPVCVLAFIILSGSCIALYVIWERARKRVNRAAFKTWVLSIDEINVKENFLRNNNLQSVSQVADVLDYTKSKQKKAEKSETLFSQAEYRGEVVGIMNVKNASGTLSLRDVDIATHCSLWKDAKNVNIALLLGVAQDEENNFIIALEWCSKGTLEDCIFCSSLMIDSVFFFSFAKDIINGLVFLHKNEIGVHGRLSPANVVIDSRWTCKLVNFGQSSLIDQIYIEQIESVSTVHNQLLWSSPECISPRLEFLLESLQAKKVLDVENRNDIGTISETDSSVQNTPGTFLPSSSTDSSSSRKGSKTSTGRKTSFTKSAESVGKKISNVFMSKKKTQPSKLIYPASREDDIFAFAITLGQILSRQKPYYELGRGSYEAVSLVQSNQLTMTFGGTNVFGDDQQLVRSNVVTVLQHCVSFDTKSRPNSTMVRDEIQRNNPSGTSGIADNLAVLLERYSQNLESIIEERTFQLRRQTNRVETLLFEMMPKSVAQKLIENELVVPEMFDMASIFFSDIVGFTTICSKSTPTQVVVLLNNLYSVFDNIIDPYDVYKVETIGDAYMVVSGVPNRNGTLHAKEIATISLHLVAAMSNLTIEHLAGEMIKLRVGFHSGPVAAGVVGVKMPRYCLFGDTVNTSSRMESTGEALRIHCSNVSAEFLKKNFPEFHLQERGEIEVKGKGKMSTYWLTGADDFEKLEDSAIDAIKNAKVGLSGHSFT
eukprot:Nk52_evm36s212 gene=Nk52_evmTU36s212